MKEIIMLNTENAKIGLEEKPSKFSYDDNEMQKIKKKRNMSSHPNFIYNKILAPQVNKDEYVWYNVSNPIYRLSFD